MVLKKFNQFEVPCLFNEKPNESNPFYGNPFLCVTDPEFSNLTEEDGFVDVKLVRPTKSVFMVRVYGHKVDSEGGRENQLMAPAYATRELAQESIDKQEGKYPGLFHHSEVEEVTIIGG